MREIQFQKERNTDKKREGKRYKAKKRDRDRVTKSEELATREDISRYNVKERKLETYY